MDGLYPIYKEAGMTSHDVIYKLRKILNTKKIGHTGTLDPDVEGVLLCAVGHGTKLIEYLMDGQKVYEGVVTLGYSTETEDASGSLVEEGRLDTPVPLAKIQKAMDHFLGEITQIPPYYSAVRVNGMRLYEYARQGLEVKRPERQVQILRFDLTGEVDWDAEEGLQHIPFQVVCSKGTYVRTLAVDLGKALGYPAHMSQLIRSETGGFTLEDAHTLDEVREAVKRGDLTSVCYPLERLLPLFAQIEVGPEHLFAIANGQVVEEDFFGERLKGETALLYEGHWLSIYEPHPDKDGLLKPRKMLQRVVKENEHARNSS